MRKFVFDTIVAGYRRVHPLDEVTYPLMTMEELPEWHRRYDALRDGKMTIEEYLTPLTDEQLLAVYQSQCCQEFR